MRLWTSALVLAAALTSAARSTRDYDAYDYYAVHLRPGQDPQTAATQLGLQFDGPLGELDDHYIFRDVDTKFEYDHIKTQKDDLKRRRGKREAGAELPHILDHVLLSRKQELHKRFPLVKRNVPERAIPDWVRLRQGGFTGLASQEVEWAVAEKTAIAMNLSISDPIFLEQWHLYNTREIGHDINVTGVWAQNITGKGSTVCIVDDGLDFHSDDLKDSYFAQGSWDYNDPGPDPLPRLGDDRHGTRCAGEISAVRNNVCGVGVAYDGKVAGVRILSKVISDADEAEAMNYAYQQNQIYSCSWGPPDDGQAMEAPGILIRRAMVQGIQKGRGGLGSIYVFAIGNGASNDDNCNFDGYTNSIYSVSVGGIDRKGKHPYYSEKCSAQLVVTYSSGSGDAIHTTDVGTNKCYNQHGGTSAAGPLVAGMYALMLEVNPKLTWRDIQWITALTAVKMEEEAEYQLNKALNKDFSHQFGYGKADAYALVEAAKNWTNVKPQAWFFSPWIHVNKQVPQGDQGLVSHFEVTKDMMKDANLERIEHVTVTMNVEHTRRGDLSVELRSPSGMVSHIATHRRNDNAAKGYVDWTFMSVAHWGEDGIGDWAVIVKDTRQNEYVGTFVDWHLKLWGESIDGDSQPLLPMPTEHDDDNHDVLQPTHTVTGIAHTTSVAVPTDHTGVPEGNPTDHPERPTKPTAAPEPSPADESQEVSPSEAPKPEEDKTNFLPRPFPTWGVSKSTQKWIYGAIALILIFLSCLFGWMFWIRQKRRRTAARLGEYELTEQDTAESGLLANGNGHYANGGERGKNKKHGRDLYDAFAEGSDDDAADEFSLGSDEEDEGRASVESGSRVEPYRDEEPRTGRS